MSFSSILDRAPSEIERPKPLPIGTYLCAVNGLYEDVVSSQKKTPGFKFKFSVLQAGEDVDQDKLNEWMQKKDGTSRTLADASLSTTYWDTPDAGSMLMDFLCDLGIMTRDAEGAYEYDGTGRAAMAETPGRQLLVFVKHRPSKDGQMFFAEVGSTAPVEE